MESTMKEGVKPENASPLAVSVLRILAYFDIFHYPLSSEEIYNYCDFKNISREEMLNELEILSKQNIIGRSLDFYFLGTDRSVVEKRLAANLLSERYMKKARKYSGIIAAFPFVKGVCISGSVSKGSADNKADIDYFILTEPGRLWISRTLLVLFKKLFLFNSRKYFCVNYFIDTDHLEIPDKNIFTATEIVFLIPTYEHENYLRFIQANKWTGEHYPNLTARAADHLVDIKRQPLKRILERLLDGRGGEILDSLCFRLTLARWKRKFSNFNESDFDLKMRSRKYVSKHHPQGFQNKVLTAYSEKISVLENHLGIPLAEKVIRPV